METTTAKERVLCREDERLRAYGPASGVYKRDADEESAQTEMEVRDEITV